MALLQWATVRRRGDVFEALQSVRKQYPIDEKRLVVRGFSLGGAACWHMAVHHAGIWAARPLAWFFRDGRLPQSVSKGNRETHLVRTKAVALV